MAQAKGRASASNLGLQLIQEMSKTPPFLASPRHPWNQKWKDFCYKLLGVCLGYVEHWNHLTMEQNTWLFDIDMEIIPSCYQIIILIWSYHDHMILAFFLLPGSLTVAIRKIRFWLIDSDQSSETLPHGTGKRVDPITPSFPQNWASFETSTMIKG